MSIPQISVDELAARLETGVPLFDVREIGEYETAHVEGAVLIPMGEVAESVDRFHDDRPISVICGSGVRSARVVEFLQAQGIDAHNVDGGTGAWIKSGRPVASQDS